MGTRFAHSRALILGLALTAIGCHAQNPAAAPAAGVSPELARRIEIMIRDHSEIPADYTMTIASRTKSELPGYDQISVVFSTREHTSKPVRFLLSDDGKTLAKFDKFDISVDPKTKVSAEGRPSRGGPPGAPVTIVVYDDLQCPFCARMHAALFPALMERYGDNVHIVYRDFPLSQHNWAIHAAVDANCLAAQNGNAYWNYVDYVHAHAGEINGDGQNLAKVQSELDKLTTDEGAKDKLNSGELAACVKKQDDTQVRASEKEGEALNLGATPTLFINGEKVEGAIPVEYVYRMIDQALVAAGKTPPPPYVPPAAAPPASGAAPASSAPAVKPGT